MVDSSAAKTGRLDTPRSSYDVAVDVRDAHLERGTFSLRIGELRIRRGECVALIGPSGSGKTTLLEMIAGVLPSTSGELIVAGQPLSALSESQRRRFRAGRIGMVFQEFELLEYLHVRDNVLLPFRLQPGSPIAAANWRRADDLLEAAGLGDKLLRPVRRLSQGERQRVAICR
ncbi:MAG: ATP-binding cassette domain-containing protein, partial [Pirellulaceae bacterium]|nr:ATP-binding cassette domain-containing protein [Pirellulaceae bacterium]